MVESRMALEYVRGPRPGDLHVRLPRSRPAPLPPASAPPWRGWLHGLLSRWTRAAG